MILFNGDEGHRISTILSFPSILEWENYYFIKRRTQKVDSGNTGRGVPSISRSFSVKSTGPVSATIRWAAAAVSIPTGDRATATARTTAKAATVVTVVAAQGASN